MLLVDLLCALYCLVFFPMKTADKVFNQKLWSTLDTLDNLSLFYLHCVQQDETLRDCMMFALLNDKMQFVDLFIEKKFNFKEYRLTYGLLETFYRAVGWGRIVRDEDTLLYKLLLEHLKDRLGTSCTPYRYDPLSEISLLEVGLGLDKNIIFLD